MDFTYTTYYKFYAGFMYNLSRSRQVDQIHTNFSQITLLLGMAQIEFQSSGRLPTELMWGWDLASVCSSVGTALALGHNDFNVNSK